MLLVLCYNFLINYSAKFGFAEFCLELSEFLINYSAKLGFAEFCLELSEFLKNYSAKLGFAEFCLEVEPSARTAVTRLSRDSRVTVCYNCNALLLL